MGLGGSRDMKLIVIVIRRFLIQNVVGFKSFKYIKKWLILLRCDLNIEDFLSECYLEIVQRGKC